MCRSIVVPLVLAAATLPAAGEDLARVEAWIEDVRFVQAALERLHPDPYFAVPRAEFHAAVRDFEARVAEYDDDRAVVELMRLMAVLAREGREGHSGIYPMGFRLLPIQIYRFAEGWYVVAAPPEHAELVGMRVTGLGDAAIADAEAQVVPLLACDNESQRSQSLAWALLMPEVLHALGFSPERESAAVRCAGEDGEERTIVLPGQTIREYRLWNRFPPVQLPEDPAVRWLAPSQGAFWYEVLDEEGALYVRYDAVAPFDAGRTLAEFAGDLVAIFQDLGLERVILELRNNDGGNNTTFPPLIEALRGCDDLNRRGRLYALVGRGTFSAAGNFVTVLQRDTEAILVGEDTGGAPNQYGDAESLFLPNHPDVMVRIATRYHCFGGPDDPRLTHTPDLVVPLTAAAYFAGEDPVLQRALED